MTPITQIWLGFTILWAVAGIYIAWQTEVSKKDAPSFIGAMVVAYFVIIAIVYALYLISNGLFAWVNGG